MILDSLLELSNRQTVTATGPSTNTVDFKQAAPNLGLGDVPLYAVFTVNENFTGLTSLSIRLDHGDTDTAMAALSAAESLPVARLRQGFQYVIPLPINHKRFVRANYTVNGAATGGSLSAHITTSIQQNEPKPDSPRA